MIGPPENLPRQDSGQLEEIRIAVTPQKSAESRPAIHSADWWRRRRRDYLLDRRHVCRAIGAMLLATAAVNMVPPVVAWRAWSSDWAAAPLARWVFLQGFAAAWIGLYAVFVWQVCHWTSLRAAAVAISAASLFWAVLAAGLRFGSPNGGWAAWLQLNPALVPRGSLWCLAMLCLCLVVVFLCGREAQRWHRTELLLAKVAAE